MLNRIVFLTIQDKFEVVRLRGKIYFTNYILCSEEENGVQHTFNIKVGKYSERCEAEGIVFIPLVVDRFGGWHKAMCVLLEDMRVLEVPEVLYLNQVR